MLWTMWWRPVNKSLEYTLLLSSYMIIYCFSLFSEGTMFEEILQSKYYCVVGNVHMLLTVLVKIIHGIIYTILKHKL